MKCDICDNEVKKTIRFYWGFFKSEYEPDKWIFVCKDCATEFLKSSNIANTNRMPLIEFENKIKQKVKVRK